MKRVVLAGGEDDRKTKRVRPSGDGGEEGFCGSASLDENLVYEVLRHADARTVAAAACVSRLWRRTARDERLWEALCTSHWPTVGIATHQLRSVVLALGGFRRLHSLYLWPLSKTHGSALSLFPPAIGKSPPARWGRDEVHLSLSLLSIRFYEKMSSGAGKRN